MSVTGILTVLAEIKLVYQKIVRPFISWQAKRSAAREKIRHAAKMLMVCFATAIALSGCARYDHAMIWLDHTLPDSGESAGR